MLYTITFWTDQNMGEFWGNVKMLLQTIQPGIMLVFALSTAGLLIGLVVRLFHKSAKDGEDHEDDYEIRRY
ncbi:hypothetical protein MUN88_14195 [Gracilibacillus caseinilyticus]|uniref:Uncharacterized protein n=1 Tax=Gracilibacillus caseinilyticus TaxID=2932256 RepID=A0ABY4ESP4_9BACI|nr:hypothetical protein [Gracilibacillus caseinilyticus]UOQ47218.1 hypothetical protein MUN88_14195 [Gracilibacillus caseinilyticus]